LHPNLKKIIIIIEHEIGFCHLDMSSVTKAFNTTKNRVLLLDLNGTIVFKEPPGKYLKREILGSSGLTVEPEVRFKFSGRLPHLM